ncbi:phospholipase [Marinobacter vulgaris]|uniref:Phospholipase A1 n=1 Tax=Marinobacter vulgaris TaxID=1928331 RepID=A0A2V3ZMG3_9GAMM|nr:phospholipase A [Marinobacter vulgaris]PXX92299.1 phospholipase [Marinobacter vulgaris]TSJ71758.1 phospholipase A [Marinobacter vulgaris]
MPTIFSPGSVKATGLIVCLGAVSATAAEPQPPTEAGFDDLSPQDCALIRDGVQRLACYDAINSPQAAREQATEEEIRAVADSAETLEYEELADAKDGDETVEELDTMGDDEGSGVASALVNREVAAESAIFSFSGGFVGHRPMYILPFSYMRNANRTPDSPRLGTTRYDHGIDNQEAKYQISFKVPLLTGWLDNRTTLWFGYTQKSFWQVYNTEDSAPFRETNFEPELFLRYALDYDIGPGTINGVTLGLNHASNGQSEPRSRSWNRIVGSANYSYDRWLFMVQPWYRLPDSEDDNEDIERYVGHADYRAVYKWSEDRTLSLTLQNNLRSDNNRTSVELGYSFPLGSTIKGYVQYFNGYGESLIDYNQRIQRIGIGIMLNDWL